QLLRGFAAAGLVIVVLGTGFSVLMAVVYNLISDVVGGIQITVLEEDPRAVRAADAITPESASVPTRSGRRGEHRAGRPVTGSVGDPARAS
ncbi:MAG TPA: DUF3566 domain-containing protein, partial [Acidimicrobiales bacterium]